MKFNKILQVNDYNLNLLNVDFNLFQHEVNYLKNFYATQKTYHPFGSEFDEPSIKQYYSFYAEDLYDTGVQIQNFNQYIVNADSDFAVKLQKAQYNEGFIYQSTRSIYFYNVLINLGTVIYINDNTYKDFNSMTYANRFIFIQTPDFKGYNIDYNIDSFNDQYTVAFNYKNAFNYYTTKFQGPTGNTRWNFACLLNSAATYPIFDSRALVWIADTQTICINKTSVTTFNNKNFTMAPQDYRYCVDFIDNNGNKIFVDYSIKNTCSVDMSKHCWTYWIEVKIDDSYSQDSLNWLRNNGKVIIY